MPFACLELKYGKAGIANAWRPVSDQRTVIVPLAADEVVCPNIEANLTN
jgi:hypothetical protein